MSFFEISPDGIGMGDIVATLVLSPYRSKDCKIKQKDLTTSLVDKFGITRKEAARLISNAVFWSFIKRDRHKVISLV